MVQLYPPSNVHSTKALDRLVVSIRTSRSTFLPAVDEECNSMMMLTYIAMMVPGAVHRKESCGSLIADVTTCQAMQYWEQWHVTPRDAG